MKKLLLLITVFIAFTAGICGLMMVNTPNGSSMQLSLAVLTHTPFKDFTIPGYILFLIVGGSNALAALALITRQKKAFSFSMAAGLFISGWIVVQVILTGVLFWLQFVYLAAGISILLLSFHLKEKAIL
jgi:hypothetical protein